MNAKLLTLIFSVSALLLANFLVVPGYTEYKRVNAALKNSERAAAAMREISAVASNFQDRSVQLQDHATALSTAVSNLVNSQAQYGIRVSQLSGQAQAAGQVKVPMVAFVEPDPITKLSVQKLNIRGQYMSILDFESFVSREFNPSKAVVVDSLTLQGDLFELGVSLFSKAN